MNSKAGFSLVHVLAAISVLSLAVAVLGQTLTTLSRYQARSVTTLERTEMASNAGRRLGLAIDEITDLSLATGDNTYFSAHCREAVCRISIRGGIDAAELETNSGIAPISPGSTLEYQTTAGTRSNWPSPDPTESLVAIALVSDGRPIAVARVREKQMRDCEYDAVIRDCRQAIR